MDTLNSTPPSAFRRSLRPTIAGFAALALVAGLAACSATTPTTTSTSTSTSTATETATDTLSEDSNTAEVIAAANAFIATLTDEQLATLEYDYSDTTAKANWSNLPEGSIERNGLAMGDLTDEQKAAALAVVEAMLSEDGYQQVLDTMAADDALGASSGGNGLSWSSVYYYIAFFGTPSADSPFMISFGGHHLAINIDYNGDTVSITPEFLGIEPQTFTASDGSTVETMAAQKSAVFALLGSLSADELAASELSSLYDDVVMGPGQDDGSYPSDTGVLVSSLTEEQQDLVTEAIRAWVGVADEGVAEAIIESYVADYDETYVMWSGSTDSESEDAYFRISGPAVWIEYVHQSGVGFSGVHLHSVYRDKTSDYGA
jgi:hypothetical protein